MKNKPLVTAAKGTSNGRPGAYVIEKNIRASSWEDWVVESNGGPT